MNKIISLLLAFCLLFVFSSCSLETDFETYDGYYKSAAEDEYSEDSESFKDAGTKEINADVPDENGVYDSKEDVLAYLICYGKLPKNFITKKEARALGWESGGLEKYAPGKCIGGDYFGNYEGLLPEKDGREYHECDIDTMGKNSRGAKRMVYSSDGLIYYSDDHYESFSLLYGEE